MMMGGVSLRFVGLTELAFLACPFLFLRQPSIPSFGPLASFLSRRQYPRSRVPAVGVFGTVREFFGGGLRRFVPCNTSIARISLCRS